MPCFRLKRAFKKPRFFAILVTGWIFFSLLFYLLMLNTPSPDSTINQSNSEDNGLSNLLNDRNSKEHTWGGDLRSRRVALIIHKYTKPTTPKALNYILRYLESFRIRYVVTRTDDRLLVDLKYEMMKDIKRAKYSLIIFYEFQTLLTLSPFARGVINNYCAKFNTGQIFFAGNNYGKVTEFNIEVKRVEKDSHYNLRINPSSSILWITKPGVESAKASRTRLSYIRVEPFEDRYDTVAYFVRSTPSIPTKADGSNDETRVAMLLDDGRKTGIKRIFTTLSSAFFLNGLLFLDALKYLSVLPQKYTLQRYIQVDIDDIFIGKTGLRLKRSDVKELIQTQKYLQRKIPGFQFQVGFSGKGFKRGNDEEDDGDMTLIEHATSFSWFCHMWDHEQAHKFDNLTILTNLMEKNKRFGKKHGIILDSAYAVASHHSGVYPVQETLYHAWKQVYGITVTTTEEYPNLKPAWQRRGFQHMGIKVLPRQTCNVYTSTNFFRDVQGGKAAFDGNIEGGELFETLLRNPVSIFMTHMTNYGNDRLAPYMFKKLVKFVQRWTNLKLVSAPPKQLAEIYFRIFPEDTTPIWQNPCDDNRHLVIWPIDKSCFRLPSLLVMGPLYGGLDVLGQFLQLHPRMKGPEQTNNGLVETKFFSTANYLKGLDWYMNFFPKQTELYEKIFEVSSTYFESSVATYRANALLKIAKIIIVLPDPVQRTYIHYMHLKSNHVSRVAEKYTFEAIIMDPTASTEVKALRDRLLTPGHYANHLMRWITYYSPQQVMIISDDDLVYRAPNVLQNIQDFVNIEKPVNYNQLLRHAALLLSPHGKGFIAPYSCKHNKGNINLHRAYKNPLNNSGSQWSQLPD